MLRRYSFPQQYIDSSLHAYEIMKKKLAKTKGQRDQESEQLKTCRALSITRVELHL